MNPPYRLSWRPYLINPAGAPMNPSYDPYNLPYRLPWRPYPINPVGGPMNPSYDPYNLEAQGLINPVGVPMNPSYDPYNLVAQGPINPARAPINPLYDAYNLRINPVGAPMNTLYGPINPAYAMNPSDPDLPPEAPGQLGLRCSLCRNPALRTYRIAEPYWPWTDPNYVTTVAELPCGHAYHRRCLQAITPPELQHCPPCLSCTIIQGARKRATSRYLRNF